MPNPAWNIAFPVASPFLSQGPVSEGRYDEISSPRQKHIKAYVIMFKFNQHT